MPVDRFALRPQNIFSGWSVNLFVFYTKFRERPVRKITDVPIFISKYFSSLSFSTEICHRIAIVSASQGRLVQILSKSCEYLVDFVRFQLWAPSLLLPNFVVTRGFRSLVTSTPGHLSQRPA